MSTASTSYQNQQMSKTNSRNSNKSHSKADKKAKAKSAAEKPVKLSEKESCLIGFKAMVRARLNDEKSIVLYKQNKCHFQIGCAGHEAVGAAAGQVFRPGKDWFYPYYREMALCTALGMTSVELMLNAMNKLDDPNSYGRQMPMHYAHKKLNIVSQSSPTGTQLLQAVGCAMAAKKRGTDEVTYVSLGEGTVSQGDFHEAINWAAREALPVVFVVHNNGFAISVPVCEQLAGESAYKIVAGYEGLERFTVDGCDFSETRDAFKKAYARAAQGDGPSLIEANVIRLQSHSISDNHLKYRSQDEINAEKKRDPILKMRKFMAKKGFASEKELTAIETEIKAEVDAAAEEAEKHPDPTGADATTFNYKNPTPWEGIEEKEAAGEKVYIIDAINHALDEELARDQNVLIFGQDVAHGKGGVFTATTGLTKKYGNDRVFNAPLAESSIAGVAVGLASVGMKPVAEIQFGDYIWTAMMQIRNELAMMHYRSGGDFSAPAVLRVPVGGYIHGGCYHSQNIEATFAHFPGLYVAYPSNATDAKGMLKAAIRGSDPVLFLEHKGLYRQVYAMGNEGGVDDLVPFGKAKVVRQGHSATIVTWGAIVNKALLAAKEIAEQHPGTEIEVVDIRSIVPLDMETIFESVKKTSRVLIAHEDTEFMGFGAEIAAKIASDCFEHLDAPVKRVGMKYVAAVGHSPAIEQVVLPQNEDVLKAVTELINY